MKRILILLAALSPAAATAQPHCNGQTQIDANFCAMEKWEIADRELNRLWNQVKPAADARGTGPALLAEQRAWLKRRDAACGAEQASGGSAAPMFYWSCMERETLQRNRVLRSLR
ncbi:lysozyme inhibitor LprI family protein [Leisingera caerulea]|uniref:lysozyme inhibitor LprI family protein n=1 Tax=Leisingera caerulea TaxID=506591 RepID=UPI0021A832A0|nr:lysozyme inhibitor LprI family protein [Leisingera caerulea]UWQ62157.1 lysozyme inhibitor LprI family protein [Leisingera caerulea]